MARIRGWLTAAGHGDAKMEEKVLKRLVIEGNNRHFIEDTWNTAKIMPLRAPIEPATACEKCKAAAEEAGGFSKLGGRIREAMAEWEGASNIASGMGNISVAEQKDEPVDVEMSG